jgi:hypothetical protein
LAELAQVSNEELSGRMMTLEVIAITALGLYIANSRNDPDLTLARGLLDHLRNMIDQKARELPDAAALSARSYSDELLSQVLESLNVLRGGK